VGIIFRCDEFSTTPVPNYTAWWQRHVLWTTYLVSSHGSEPARSGTRDLLIASPTPEALRHKIKYILTSDCVQQRERDGVVPRAESLRQVFLRLMSRLVKLMGEKMLTFSCIRTSTSELDLPLHFILMLNTERQTHTHTHTHTHTAQAKSEMELLHTHYNGSLLSYHFMRHCKFTWRTFKNLNPIYN